MNDERRAGEALSRLAFGLGAPPKPVPLPRGSTVTQQKVKQGLGGCSCTRRKKVK